LWQHVSTQFVHLPAINIKLIKALCALVADGYGNGDISSVIKSVHVEVSDFVL
jgi:hypothetical protein